MTATVEDGEVISALAAVYAEVKATSQLHDFRDSVHPETVWGKLRIALEAHPEFSKGRHVFAGNHQFNFYPASTAAHIARAVNNRGPEGTLLWLKKIYALTEIESRECAELLGAKIDSAVSFQNGVQLMPFSQMRASWHTDQLNGIYSAQRYIMENRPPKGVGMMRVVTIPLSEDVSTAGSDELIFSDIAHGLTICSEFAPVVGKSWSEFEDHDLNDSEVGWSHRSSAYDGRAPRFQQVEIGEAEVSAVNRFLILTGATRQACTTAASRLNSARRRLSAGDSAIDLCTAFEAVLATKDERTEMTYRFRLRAALMLEDEYSARQQVSKKMGHLYSLRGKMVHGDAAIQRQPIDSEIVDWAEKACAQLLRRIVAAGRLPNLRRLELTGDQQQAFVSD